MTDINALPALLARVEAATGPDRELDRDLMLAIGEAREIDDNLFYGPGEIAWYFGRYEDDCNMPPLPHLTSSLDATVALVEKLRPDIRIDVIKRADGTGYGCIWTKSGNRSNNCATPHLALLAALLRSMIEEGGGSERAPGHGRCCGDGDCSPSPRPRLHAGGCRDDDGSDRGCRPHPWRGSFETLIPTTTLRWFVPNPAQQTIMILQQHFYRPSGGEVWKRIPVVCGHDSAGRAALAKSRETKT